MSPPLYALVALVLFALVQNVVSFTQPFQFRGLALHSVSVRPSPSTQLMAEPVPTTGLVTKEGKRFEAVPGSSMLAATKKLGLKVPLDCKKGDCGTCTVTCGGQKVRACIGKVPPAPKLKSLKEKGLVVTVDNA